MIKYTQTFNARLAPQPEKKPSLLSPAAKAQIGAAVLAVVTAVAGPSMLTSCENGTRTTIEVPVTNPVFQGPAGIAFNGIGEFTQADIAAIQDRIAGLDIAQFVEYIDSVNFVGNGDLQITAGTGTGEQATVVITISRDATIEEIEAALEEAMNRARGTRDAAREDREQAEREEAERIAAEAEAAFRAANPIVDGPLEIEGITFTLAGAAGFDTRNPANMAIISGVTATLADLGDLSAFGSITGVTFGDVVDTTAGFDYNLDGDAPDVTVTITVPFGATAQQVQAALTAAQAIADENNTITTDPVDFLTLSFEGRETVLFAAPGIDQAIIDAIRANLYNEFNVLVDDGDRRIITSRIASWTLVEEAIDGGLKIDIGNDGRAIITSNNSSTDDWVVFEEIFIAAFQVGARGAMQAMGTNALTVSSR